MTHTLFCTVKETVWWTEMMYSIVRLELITWLCRDIAVIKKAIMKTVQRGWVVAARKQSALYSKK